MSVDFEALRAQCETIGWDEIVGNRNRPETICAVADLYAEASSSIICWAMGITQHVDRLHNVQAILNYC